MAFADTARFYSIQGRELPSVTTILQVIAKPALIGWAANEERKAFEAALLEVLSERRAIEPDWVLGELAGRIKGVKASERAKRKAADIGTAAHELIRWHSWVMMHQDTGREPKVPDAALWAVEAWKEWAKRVDFRPIWVETKVWHMDHGYAGTFDAIAYVEDVLVLLDYKSGGVYPEAFLQNIAYRVAAEECGMPTDGGLIVRLPKVVTDTTVEAVPVPESTSIEDFLAALRLWRWQRTAEGKTTGSQA